MEVSTKTGCLLVFFVSFLFIFSFGEKCLHVEVSIKGKEKQVFFV